MKTIFYCDFLNFTAFLEKIEDDCVNIFSSEFLQNKNLHRILNEKGMKSDQCFCFAENGNLLELSVSFLQKEGGGKLVFKKTEC